MVFARFTTRVMVLVAVVALFVTVTTMDSRPALAGSNGQQIALWEDPTVDWACFEGNNQNNQYTYTCRQTPNVGYWYYFAGYWWKGYVAIDTTAPGGGWNGYAPTCNVPVSYGLDYWTCYVP